MQDQTANLAESLSTFTDAQLFAEMARRAGVTSGRQRKRLTQIADTATRPADGARFVSGSCKGEHCFCGKPAEHKVEEVIQRDDPQPIRHPLTSYICHEHFVRVMGPLRPAPRCRASLASTGRASASPRPRA